MSTIVQPSQHLSASTSNIATPSPLLEIFQSSHFNLNLDLIPLTLFKNFKMKLSTSVLSLCSFIVTVTATANQFNNTGTQVILSDSDLARAQYYRQNREVVNIEITTADDSIVDVESPFMKMEVQ